MVDEELRGFLYVGADEFQSDREDEVVTTQESIPVGRLDLGVHVGYDPQAGKRWPRHPANL